MNGMDLADITPRYLAPADVVTSVVSGESDTAIVWDPYVYQIQQQLGPDNTTWNAQGGQKYYWVAFTREDMIRSRPSGIRKYLRALGEAEAFIDSHPSEAQEIHRRRMNTTSEYGDRIWQQNQFLLTLDQALIVAMEDEARWMAAQNLTGGNTTPSYLDMVYQDAMRETWPSAVTIIR